MVTLGNGTALVAFEWCLGGGMCTTKTVIKRSSDGGQTWGSKHALPDWADMASLAGRGSTVDLAYRTDDGRLAYVRSTNSGSSYSGPILLARNYSTRYPHAARGPKSLVAVAWGEWPQFVDQISVRVSTDGGNSFGPKTSWPTADVDFNDVAAGRGVVYVASMNTNGVAIVSRSVDGGGTWANTLTLSDSPHGYPQLAAWESKGIVAYNWTDPGGRSRVRYRLTNDKGMHWSSPPLLAPGMKSWDPAVTMQGGVFRATFENQDGLYYTESPDGIAWTAPELVAKRGSGFLGFSEVGFVGRPIVVYEVEPNVLTRTRMQ